MTPAFLSLDSANGQDYFYFMMAAASQLAPPLYEYVMNELKDYRFIFPIHDHEFDLVEKGELQGLEKGIELGKQAGIEIGVVDCRLQQAKETLGRLDAAAAAELGQCAELAR